MKSSPAWYPAWVVIARAALFMRHVDTDNIWGERVMDILGIIQLCITAITNAILMPYENIGFIVFIFIIYSQYKRTVSLQEYIYGKPKTNMGNLLATSVLSGLIAGTIISIMMALVGVSFNQTLGVEYMMLLSLILMAVEPRFICFSYSGGILSLVCLIFGWSFIDVTGVLLLVAILHLLEAALIYIDGHRGAVPVFFQREDGSITGGFTMQRLWPIPLALVLFYGYGQSQGGVPTPDWWPAILPSGVNPNMLKDALFSLSSLCAILGYSDFTSSYLPREKCRSSSLKLVFFSVSLFILAMLSSHIYIFKFIAAVFAPLAHEALIEGEKRLEKKRKPLFEPVDNGIRVLDTLPGGPADRMGIKSGDTVVSINNSAVNNSIELADFFKGYITYIWVDILDRHGLKKTYEYRDYKEGVDTLGILAVPDNTEGLTVVRERKSLLKRLLGRLRG